MWGIARTLVIDMYQMTMTELPRCKCYKERRQIHRSSKSITSTAVEGYGRLRHSQNVIRILIYALASCDETTGHLETLSETTSLTDQTLYEDLHDRLETLGTTINAFLHTAVHDHKTTLATADNIANR